MTRVLRPGRFLHVVAVCHLFHAIRQLPSLTTRGQQELLPASQCIVLDEGIRTGDSLMPRLFANIVGF